MILLTSLLSAGGFAAKAARRTMQTKNRVFTVRILFCIRNEILKKSKKAETGLLRGKRVHFVEDAQSLEHNSADNLQAARAEFVDRIFRRVPVSDVVAVSEID